jgi:hypothetical protein
MKRKSDKGGLCLLNNVAIGALHALDRCLRIAIIDIGVHHGEGTEEIVRYQGGCRWIDLVNAWMDEFMGGCFAYMYVHVNGCLDCDVCVYVLMYVRMYVQVLPRQQPASVLLPSHVGGGRGGGGTHGQC